MHKKTTRLSNRFTFPNFLAMNAESLNFNKLIELEALFQVNKIAEIF